MASKNEQLQANLTVVQQKLDTANTTITALKAALTNADAENTTLKAQLATAQADAISDANLALSAQLGEIVIPS